MPGADSGARRRGFELLKAVFCQPGTTANADTAPQDRTVRKALWRCLRDLACEPMERSFAHRELSGVDLYDLDFRGAELSGVSLDESFLVESDFVGANLERATLCNCRIRNVNLSDARLSGADMSSSDWFNAKGLTAGQLAVVRPGTLRLCPPTMNDILESLSGDYAYPFSSWSRKVQQELQEGWKRYVEDPSFLPWRIR
jgi:hypothetical protein